LSDVGLSANLERFLGGGHARIGPDSRYFVDGEMKVIINQANFP